MTEIIQLALEVTRLPEKLLKGVELIKVNGGNFDRGLTNLALVRRRDRSWYRTWKMPHHQLCRIQTFNYALNKP